MVVDHDLTMVDLDAVAGSAYALEAARTVVCLDLYCSCFDLVGLIVVAAGIIGYYIVLCIMEFIDLGWFAHIG